MNIAVSSDKIIKLSNRGNNFLLVEGRGKKKRKKIKLFSVLGFGDFGVFLRVTIKLAGSLYHLSSKYDRCKQLKFQV